jgi:AcrR family transcriptional regulator
MDAALEVIREDGFGALTIRGVAGRAGVTHTTAYTYFTSKEHLVAELSWRLLRDLPPPVYDGDASLAERLIEALRATSEMFVAEPALAEALLAALVAGDVETLRVRTSIGAEVARRIATAVGPDADPRISDGALLLYSGAMLQAGLGYFTFDEAVERIGAIAELFVDRPDGG